MGVFKRMAQKHWKKYLPNLTAALMKKGTFDQETEQAAQMASEELATPGKQRGATGSSEGDSAEGVHPSPAGNYRITDPTLNDPKSVPVRFSLNLSAVKVLNLIESENRTPTDAEKDILAQYSGWGGMSELFAYEPTAAWAGKAELLKAELTEDEMRDAASSSTSSYYTPVPVGTFMWKLAQRLGFENGVVLDPATGANGLFLGTMPADLAQGTALQGIEMDTLSARIASQLYGLASIENKPFQDVKKPNNRFDLTITNVPFENITPTDLKHNKGGHRLHNYFINKMLNLTAPGALSMMITTSNTLDAVGAHLTEFAEKAQLCGCDPASFGHLQRHAGSDRHPGVPQEDRGRQVCGRPRRGMDNHGNG